MRFTPSISQDQHFVVTKFGVLIETARESFADKNSIAIAEILRFPFSVYFEDPEGYVQLVNETNAALCGFDSPTHARHKKYFCALPKVIVQDYRRNDLAALNGKQITIVDEYANHSPDQAIVLSLKWPWIDENANVIGLFGVSIDTSDIPTAHAITLLQAQGLLNLIHKFPARPQFGKLTKRELQCAKLLKRGKSAKEIAVCLNLSARTIEHFIEAMKMKFDCRKKSELIEKLQDMLLD